LYAGVYWGGVAVTCVSLVWFTRGRAFVGWQHKQPGKCSGARGHQWRGDQPIVAFGKHGSECVSCWQGALSVPTN
jgi:hypothetical protein